MLGRVRRDPLFFETAMVTIRAWGVVRRAGRQRHPPARSAALLRSRTGRLWPAGRDGQMPSAKINAKRVVDACTAALEEFEAKGTISRMYGNGSGNSQPVRKLKALAIAAMATNGGDGFVTMGPNSFGLIAGHYKMPSGNE